MAPISLLNVTRLVKQRGQKCLPTLACENLSKHPVKHYFPEKKSKLLGDLANKGTERERERDHRETNNLLPKSDFRSWINGDFILTIDCIRKDFLFVSIPQVLWCVIYHRIFENERGRSRLSQLWEREGSEMIWAGISFTRGSSHTSGDPNSTSWESLFHFQTTLLIITPCARHWAKAQKVVSVSPTYSPHTHTQTCLSQPELHFSLSKQHKISINISLFQSKFMPKQGLV